MGVQVPIDSIQAVAGYQTIECGGLPPVPGDSRPSLRPTTFAGCGRLLSWVFAYRCVDCGLFFHHACILKHFQSSADKISAEEAARMMIGPESGRTNLLDAIDDVVRDLVRLRREREHLIEADHQLHTEIERLRDVAWKQGNRADEAEVEIERVRAALAEIESGYEKQLSAAELASMARQALSAGITTQGYQHG